MRLGKIPEVDFTFQSSLFGGRLDKGGLVVDFIFVNPPDLAISVLGGYFHYVLNGGNQFQDLLSRELLAAEGITLIFIDENDLLEDARTIVAEALVYRDHSAVVKGGRP